MIILTTPSIKHVHPKRISSVVKYAGSDFCLAEVDDNISLTQQRMNKYKIPFWWELGAGHIDSEEWDYDAKYKGGLIEGIEWVYSLSKEKNIAIGIYEIARNAGLDPFVLWEQSIKAQ